MTAQVVRGKKIILFVNSLKTFSWHRRPIADLLLPENEVIVLSPKPNDTEDFEEVLNKYDVRFLSLSRKGINPLSELVSIFQIAKIFLKEKPDIVHSFTIKPVLYSTLASMALPNSAKMVNSITGLGYAFTKRKEHKILFSIVSTLYYLILRFSNAFYIFQKQEDYDELNKIYPIENYKIIPGSGVDTTKFKPSPLPIENNILMVSRLIKEKGVLIYLEALRLLKEEGIPFQAKLIGPIDHDAPNPVSQEELDPYINENIVEYIPNSTTIEEEMKWAKIVCYPTYYNEGIPKVFLEAKASGRLMPNNYELSEKVISFKCTKIPPKELANRIKKLSEVTNEELIQKEAETIKNNFSSGQIALDIALSYA